MGSWRTVRGHIQRLDHTLVTDNDVLTFFEEERILGRGASDGGGGFDFEVAVGGRRRRVATLDEEGTVFRGRSVSDLLEAISERLRKVEVELDGVVAHGPIDIGSVDVSDEALLEDPDEAPGEEPGEAQGEGPQEPDDHAEAYDREGPMMVIADLPLSEVPGIVKTEDADVAVSKLGDALVMVADTSLHSVRKIFPRPSFQITVSAGSAEQNPTLYVRRDNSYLTWDWTGELPAFSWIEPGSEAHDFVVDETGAGAVARKMVADVIAARFVDIRTALQANAAMGMRALVAALGLPKEIADSLEGLGSLSDIPNSRLFRPSTAGAAFEDRLAFELAGEGFVEPTVMGAYRKVYLERPWAVALASAAQTAIAGAVLAVAFNRSGAGKSWKMLAALGGAGVVSGLTRIVATSYASEVVSQRQSDIETWKHMRNWQENHD
ncbi:hypothetical protein [Trueperella pecoris]|uniref:Transmembrane protein n=1 Tax=Trueperella pecoris TaxID=2733571 RepID=A0A7M1QTN8_9ACTO|nr:hypothetical protein [Trueperella pecoris]QOR45502.1 hypothetical protein INS88_09640 [Trueperella pecoris]